MKILLIVDDITTVGGAERVCINLANVLSTMRLDSSEQCCGNGVGGGGSHKLKSCL